MRSKFLVSRGITIFETLIFLVILSFLLLISYTLVPSVMAKARDARRKADLRKISQALEHYFDKFNLFPPALPNCGQPFYLSTTIIITDFPCDPKDLTPYLYQSDGQSYQLYANFENTTDPTIASLGCDHGCGPNCFYNYGISSSNINITRCLPQPLLYVCAPGGSRDGSCEAFDDPQRSQCPIIFPDDPTCRHLCGDSHNRCQNSSGKHIPE